MSTAAKVDSAKGSDCENEADGELLSLSDDLQCTHKRYGRDVKLRFLNMEREK